METCRGNRKKVPKKLRQFWIVVLICKKVPKELRHFWIVVLILLE